jgi:ABC-type multidrug transport system ATPase subunit
LSSTDRYAKDPIKPSDIGFVPETQTVYERLTGIDYLNFIADVYNFLKPNEEK